MRVRILSRPTGAAAADGPSRTLFYWLTGAFLLTLLPHIAQLPSWLTVAILAAIVIRCIAEWKRWPLPSTTSTGVVAICLLGAIFLQFHTVLGRDAGTPFMAGLLTIKFYEWRGARDITLIIFSSFFVVMSALLFSQAIELFVYCLIMMWLLTGILMRTYMGDRKEHTLLHMLRASSMIFVQALPLALLIFFFLPRYTGRFQIRLNDTMTGISDTVEPGSIAELANDDSPAMRVSFKGSSAIPIPSDMYWRAIVLWDFDGIKWTRGDRNFVDKIEAPPAKIREGDVIPQQIVLYPQGQRWMPALDRPTDLARDPNGGGKSSECLVGDILVAPNSQLIDSKLRYTVTSTSLPLDRPLTPQERTLATQLPDNIDPRVRALADSLFPANGDTNAYIIAVLHWFRSQHFVLSTTPGRMGKDPVARFLFERRIGFCEHYASAFAVLMRLKNVPARMVVGYRGGEDNSYGNFYMVSQSNAHAWDEVWEEEHSHWKRVDPTTVISNGTPLALAANEGQGSADDDLSFSFSNRHYTLLSGAALPPWLRKGIHDVAMRREEMEAQWDNWVFSYDPETQDKIEQAMGLHKQGWMVLLIGCLFIMGAGGVLTAYLLAKKKALSPVEHFYARFCRRMAHRGAPRKPWEGPIAYTERLGEQFPGQKRPIETVGAIVAEYRYGFGEKRPTGDLKALMRETAEPK